MKTASPHRLLSTRVPSPPRSAKPKRSSASSTTSTSLLYSSRKLQLSTCSSEWTMSIHILPSSATSTSTPSIQLALIIIFVLILRCYRAPRLRLNSTLLNSPLYKRKMKASPKCEHCGQPETIEHVILSCTQYDSARSDLFAALGFRPPDDYLMEICLGRTPDRKLKGRKSTAYERASASFLLEIDRLRPHL